MTASRISVLIGGLIVALASYAFWPEIGGIMWHLRHGATVKFGDLRIAVPVFYSVSTDPNKKLVYLEAGPGRARRCFKSNSGMKVARISLDQFSEAEAHSIPVETNDRWASHNYIKTLDEAVSLSGHEGRCVGFSGPPIWDGDTDLDIECGFEDHYQAHFSGTRLGVDEFFSILKSARHSKGSD